VFEFFFKYSFATFKNGDFLFASNWPVWLLVTLCILAAVLAGLGLAQRKESLKIPRLLVVGILQTAVVALILMMLWKPTLSTEQLRAGDNDVAVLIDTSASMGYGEEEPRLQQVVTAFNEGGVIDSLRDIAEVQLHAFSRDLTSIESLEQVPPPGPATHIGSALLDILRGAGSSALGAVILVSDGSDNSNELDNAKLAEIAGFGVPVHAVGVGREQIPEDVELERVSISPQVSPGARINAQVSIRHAGASEAKLRVYDGEKILVSKDLSLSDSAGTTTSWVDFDLGGAGLKDLHFVLDSVPGEPNTINNSQFRPIEVSDQRRHILYIEGEPRWEYKFIRRAIEKDSVIRLVTLLRTTPNKFYRQGIESSDELENGFPSDRETLFAYDALIIGSFSAAQLSEHQQEMIHDFVSHRGGGLLMIGGRRGLADGGWGNTVVAEVLPATLPELDAPSFIRWPAEVFPTGSGEESLVTRLDADLSVSRALWEAMPEIGDFQYLGALKPGAVTLLEAAIQGTTHPLLVHQRFGLGTAFIMATGGTWRWQMQMDHEDQSHETFWRQLLHALVSGVPHPVTLSAEQLFYGNDAEVVFRGEVRDSKFNPVDDASVSLSFTLDSGPARSIEMISVPSAPGTYEATLEADTPGMYRFEIQARAGETHLGSSLLAARRQDGIAEHFQIQQNRPLLERLSGLTGGQYFSLDELDALPEAIRFSEAGIMERRFLDLWNMPIVFLLLIFFKGGEWLLRLAWGRL